MSSSTEPKSGTLGLVLEPQRDLAGHREGHHHHAARRAVGLQDRQRLVEPHRLAADEPRIEHVEHGVRLQHREDALGGVEAQRLRLAQVEQPRDVIDVGVGQHHRPDRTVPQSFARVQEGVLADLLAEVRRGVAEHPVGAVLAQRDGGLGPRACGPDHRRAPDGCSGGCSSIGGSRRPRRPRALAPSWVAIVDQGAGCLKNSAEIQPVQQAARSRHQTRQRRIARCC